jgi:hypothetical protein
MAWSASQAAWRALRKSGVEALRKIFGASGTLLGNGAASRATRRAESTVPEEKPLQTGLCEIFHKFALRAPKPLRILRGTVRHMVPTLSLIAISAAFTACGPTITNENLKVVDDQRAKLEVLGKGLSPKEVESILGQPKRVQTTRLALETQKKEVDVVRYYYQQDGEEIELHFVDNKLIHNAPRLGQPLATPPAK